MAETKTKKKTRVGHVSQVIGAVVDVAFEPGDQPELFEALEVKVGDGRTVVQIGDQCQAVALEPGGKARDGDRDFGCLEPGAIPADERTRQPLGQPPERSLGDALEPRRAPLPRGRVTAGMDEQSDHFATRRATTSYRKCTPKVRSSRLTRSLLPCTPRDSA